MALSDKLTSGIQYGSILVDRTSAYASGLSLQWLTRFPDA